MHELLASQTLDAAFRRGRGVAKESTGALASLPVSLDADACATVGRGVPLVTQGARVEHSWPLVSRPSAPALPTKTHQADSSADSPFFLATSSRHRPFVPELAPSDFLTHEKRHREVGRRRGVDAARRVSADAPEWLVGSGLRAPPPLTQPYARYRAGAANRMLLAPLVEVDPFAAVPPRPLPRPGAAPGYVPCADEAARMAATAQAAGRERLGLTFAAEMGAGEGGLLLGRPSALRDERNRLGRTSSAIVGTGALGATMDATSLATSDPAASAPAAHTAHNARFTDEPPYASYFSRRRHELSIPSLAESATRASWVGQGPGVFRTEHQLMSGRVGHALFDAEARRAGSTPAQHLGVSLQCVSRCAHV